MNELSKPHRAIRDQLVGKTGVRALVVEGDDDRAFVEALLNQHSPGWESGWVVGAANGKGRVLGILAQEPQWIGLVDRDEWSSHAASDAESRHSNLHVLPRFCMESYFLVADELWSALPVAKKGGLAIENFRSAIHSDLDRWVRHGALWHAVNPLWDGLRAKGFKESLLDLQAAQDDEFIRQKLAEWHEHLEPAGVFGEFRRFLRDAMDECLDRRLTQWVHGKRRFKEHVVPKLNQLIEQQSADDWFKDLSRTLSVPDDLQPLWRKMNL